jgi:hypothetical protein
MTQQDRINRAAYFEKQHQSYLERLCQPINLRQINEYPEGVHVIIKEPTYEKQGWSGKIECPDLFLGYYDKKWTVIELKHSKDKKQKAMRQIESGIKMLVDVFGIPLKKIDGKFVYYADNHYGYELFK